MKAFDRARKLLNPEPPAAPEQIELAPIGVVRSSLRDLRYRDTSQQRAAIEVLPEFAPALLGLEGFSHLLVVTWLDRVTAEERARLQQRPGARSDLPLIGAFALRIHHRPNPVGLTVVRLERVIGPRVEVIGLDAVDRTPVLDLKPYLPPYDAVPDARLPAWATGESE
jgi:tRNA-Thr(GGU) m(6)t(6)A37 methyltransferase TsaA